jgi:hypothetical protein
MIDPSHKDNREGVGLSSMLTIRDAYSRSKQNQWIKEAEKISTSLRPASRRQRMMASKSADIQPRTRRRITEHKELLQWCAVAELQRAPSWADEAMQRYIKSRLSSLEKE